MERSLAKDRLILRPTSAAVFLAIGFLASLTPLCADAVTLDFKGIISTDLGFEQAEFPFEITGAISSGSSGVCFDTNLFSIIASMTRPAGLPFLDISHPALFPARKGPAVHVALSAGVPPRPASGGVDNAGEEFLTAVANPLSGITFSDLLAAPEPDNAPLVGSFLPPFRNGDPGSGYVSHPVPKASTLLLLGVGLLAGGGAIGRRLGNGKKGRF